MMRTPKLSGTEFASALEKLLTTMIPKTIVEHDESGLEMVLRAIDQLLEERFIEGIRSKHRTLYEIEQTTELIKMHQQRLNVEQRAVVRFSENFIRSFATPNNKCFDTAQVLFGKIRSTIAKLKEVFKKTTPIDRTQLPQGVEAPSVFDKSPLGHGEYVPDMFGLESFPPKVLELYCALDTMFSSASGTLGLCHLMIEMEEKTRGDIVQLRQIYKESCDELLGTVKAASSFIASSVELPENELENLRQEAGSDEEELFLKRGYHSVNKEVMTQYLIIKTIKQARNEGLTDQEAFWFRDRKEKAFLVRKVFENFDSIKDVEGQKGHLSKEVVLEFIKWCGIKNEREEKKFYLTFVVPNYTSKGNYKVLGWSTLSGLRQELKEEGVTDEKLATDFEKRLEIIFTKEELAA